MMRLKRQIRFQKKRPTAQQRFKGAKAEKYIDIYGDSDWAKCRSTRKSVSSVIV